MNATFVSLAAAVWLISAVAVGAAMARRGHDGVLWTLAGVLAGPVAIPFALLSHWRVIRRQVPVVAPPVETGLVDVLVGFDGSPESRAAVAVVKPMFGTRLGRFVVATVVPFEVTKLGEMTARAALVDVVGEDATTMMLTGPPADAMSGYARSEGFELLVIGARGMGLAKAVGSVARSLSLTSDVPVLIVPCPAERRSSAVLLASPVGP